MTGTSVASGRKAAIDATRKVINVTRPDIDATAKVLLVDASVPAFVGRFIAADETLIAFV